MTTPPQQHNNFNIFIVTTILHHHVFPILKFFSHTENGVRTRLFESSLVLRYPFSFSLRIIIVTSPFRFFSFSRNFPPNFVEDFLKLHNKYRAFHNSPPLKIDDEVYTGFLLFPREIFFSQRGTSFKLTRAWFRLK